MIDILNFVVGSTSTLLSALAIYLYIVLWRKDKSDGAYDVFDSTYKDILSIAIDSPELRNPELTQNYRESFTGNELVKYETYAFMTLNFCETLFDKGNLELMKTWEVVIKIELDLHQSWFYKSENSMKFKKEFIDYLMQLKK
jgi:hypothetical protein